MKKSPLQHNYVTFGQDHRHEVNSTIFDKDCVATFMSRGHAAGRAKAFELFGPKFCMHYYNDKPTMLYFHRGLVKVK